MTPAFVAGLLGLIIADLTRGRRRLLPFLVPFAVASAVNESLVEDGALWAAFGSETLAAVEIVVCFAAPYLGLAWVLRQRLPGAPGPWLLGALTAIAAALSLASPGPAGVTARALILACFYVASAAVTLASFIPAARTAVRRPVVADVCLMAFALLDLAVGAIMLADSAIEPRMRDALWQEVTVTNAALFLSLAALHLLPRDSVSFEGWRSLSSFWSSARSRT